MKSTGDGDLTLSELIRLELANTNEAIGAYDSVLWKIRSGYVVILYGALSLVLGKEAQVQSPLSANVLIVCFSLLGFFTDVTFRRCQLRVVEVRNRLSDVAVKCARGEPVDPKLLDDCLQVASESKIPVPLGRFVPAAAFILALYAATPLLVLLFDR